MLTPENEMDPRLKVDRGSAPTIFTNPPSSWADSSFRFRKNITIDPINVPSDLTDFPVLIDLYDIELQQKARADGWDIMFTDASGTTLDHEIELFERTYNATHAHLVAWVRANLSGSLDTTLQLYFGNSVTRYQANPEGVWDDNYKGVWHLKESPTGALGEIKDSTANENDGTSASLSSANQVAGKIDGSLIFDDSSERHVNVSHSSSLQFASSMTVSAWAKTTDLDTDVAVILAKWGASGNRNYWLGKLDANSIAFYVDDTQSVTTNLNLINDGDWHYIVGVADAANSLLRIYVDGIEKNTNNYGGSSETGASDLNIGKSSDILGQEWDGGIDEVRVSNKTHSASWIIAEFANQYAPGSFYEVNATEIYPDTENWAFPLMRYRKSITINASKVSGSGNLTNFPVLLNITDPNLTKVQADGDDILFAAENDWKWSDELLTNGGFDLGNLSGWITSGDWKAGTDPPQGGAGVQVGSFCAFVDSSGSSSDYIRQDIDLLNYLTYISAGKAIASVSGWLVSAESGFDDSRIRVEYLNSLKNVISTPLDSGLQSPGSWTQYSLANSIIPANTRFIRVWATCYEDGWDAGSIDSFSVRVATLEKGSPAFKLDHEIEEFDPSYNSTHAHLLAWVRVPSLSGTNNTNITLYYGNNAVRSQANPEGVWGDYEGVWHLEEASGSGSYIKDSTINNHDGTPTGTQFLDPGKIGGARNFTGSANNRIEMNSGSEIFNGDPVFTFSFWIYPDYPSDPWQERGVFYKASSVRMARLLATGRFQTDIQFANYGTTYSNVQINRQEWSYITYCYDGTDLKTYVNGQNKGSISIGSDRLVADSSIFYLGATNCFPGFLDEFRVSRASRPLDWVSTEFANQNDTSSFYSIGTEEEYSRWWIDGAFTKRKDIVIKQEMVGNGVEKLVLRPNGNDTNPELTVVGSTYNWDAVNEKRTDFLTSYVYSSASSYLTDNYTVMDAPVITGAAIDTVTITAMARRSSGAAQLRTALSTHSTIFWGAEKSLTLSWSSYSTHYQTNPFTGSPWTWAEVNSMHIGVSLKGDGTSFANCTQLWVEVNYTLSDNLSDFPILVDITDSGLKSGSVQPDCADILFTDANQTKLCHEIEFFAQNLVDGHLIAWVKVPTLFKTKDTIISLYYSNPTIKNQEIPEGVWDSGFAAVWHMPEDPSGTAPQIIDSTANANHASSNGGMTLSDQVTGKVDGALDFDGTDDYLSVSGLGTSGLSSMTLSIWIYPTGSYKKAGLLTRSPGNRDNGLCIETDWNSLCFRLTAMGSDNVIHTSYPPLDQYTHVVATYDGSHMRLYVDGTLVGVVDATGLIPIEDWVLGRSSGNEDHQGILDEARVSRITRSADWIATEYSNQQNPATFYSEGSEIIFDTDSPIVNDFGVDDDGTGNPRLWAAVADKTSLVASVTLNVNGTEYSMSLNSTGYWIYSTSAVNFTDLIEYQIVNASDVYGNHITESTTTENYVLNYDTVLPALINWSYDPEIGDYGLFNVNATDSWGQIDNVRVNVTYAGQSPQNSLIAILGLTPSGYINDTLEIPRGTIRFEFIINDTAGNTFVSSEFQGFAGRNVAPSVFNVFLTPNPLHSNDTLILIYDFSDPEDDSEGGTEIRWYKNNVLQPPYNDSKQIPESALFKNDQWNVSITPKDGRDFGDLVWSPTITVQNSAPSIYAYEFIDHDYATFFVEDEDIKVSYSFQDVDADNDSSTIQWYKNGLHLRGFDTMSTIPASETEPGEIWYFEILPFDGTDYGSLVRSQSMTIESRPSIQEHGITPKNDMEGHYELWARVTDLRNSIAEVQFEIFSKTHWAQDNGSHWLLDYSFNLTDLNSNTTIKCTAISIVQPSNDEIPVSIAFNVTIRDQAPPRVLNAIYFWEEDNLANITFIAEIAEYGSGVAEVILYYYFGPVKGVPKTSETPSSLNSYADLLSGAYPLAATQNSGDDYDWQIATMVPLNTTHWGVTVPFNPKSNADIIFRIFTSDNSGNSDSNAFPDGLDPSYGESFRLEGPAGLDLMFVLGLLAVVAFLFAILSVIAIKKWRTTELVGFDKERVLDTIGIITEEEVSDTLDLHTLGIVVALFDQRHGPVPIIIIPELLRDNFEKLVELSDQSFSTCQFLNNFEKEIFASFDFILGHTAQINSISFAFALERPSARGGAENITLNLLVHPTVFPLVSHFIDYFSQSVHEIHIMMDKEPSKRDEILKMITDLRQQISYVILSYERLYGTTELLSEELDEAEVF
ncbi:MAG: DUF2341 domain-containing protein [Candidatus Hodarchaeales archaeon]